MTKKGRWVSVPGALLSVTVEPKPKITQIRVHNNLPKSNPNPNPNPNPTTKQHAIVNIQLNMCYVSR